MGPDAECNSPLCNDSCQIISSRCPFCTARASVYQSHSCGGAIRIQPGRRACAVEGLMFRNYTQLSHFLVCKDLDTAWFGTGPLNGTGRPTLTSTSLHSDSVGRVAPFSSCKSPKHRRPNVKQIRAQPRTIQDGSCCVSGAHWNPANQPLCHNTACFAVTMCCLFWNTRL